MDKIKREVVKIEGKFREIITFTDKSGKVLNTIMRPLKVEFNLKDVLQIVIGSALLALPVAFTEEVWILGSTLPLNNVLGILFLSVVFISAFVYYNYYRAEGIKGNYSHLIKRVVFTYLIAFVLVTILLFLLGKAPWEAEPIVAFSRTVLVTFPASMSGAIADTLK